ncbi:MAG: L,D-transpeptidase family protein [Woeseia sp.]
MHLPVAGPVSFSRAANWQALAALGVALVVLAYLAEGSFPGLFARDLQCADRVVVWKAARRLTLYSGDDAIATYSISLGANPLGHKTWQGDSRTPEGLYTLDYRIPDSQFYRAIHVSYPDENDLAAATEADVPAGGNIMIHGLPNGRGWIGPLYKLRDWTDGCISVTNREMEEIWRAVPDGTPIEIHP